MSGRFEACVAVVLDLEGGYADNPDDPGGATNMGITRRTLAGWRHIVPFTDLPKAEVRDLSRIEAETIYRARYWNAVQADDLPPGIDLALFDFAVNSGPHRAITELQALVGAAADGIVGPRSLTAVRNKVARTGTEDLVTAYCTARLAFVRKLKGFGTFGNGWTRRIETIETRARADARAVDSQIPRRQKMNVLEGYKTYIVAASMLVAGLAQITGVELPGFEDQSAIHLIMEALAILFLRRGIKNQTS